MDLIDRFRKQLRQTNAALFDAEHWGDLASFQIAARKVRQQFGGLGAAGPRDERSIRTSILGYRRSGDLPNYRETKYVSFGTAGRFGLDAFCLLEDRKLFPKLLDHVDNYKGEPRKFRRCYQGLLSGYFEYPGLVCNHPTGKANWTSLRGFLNKNVDFVHKQQPVVEWTSTLAEHNNLFTDKPCLRYGEALLNDDNREIIALREKLALTDRSWVLQEIILAQIEAAAKKDHSAFKAHLKRLLALIEPLEVLRNRGLAQLLVRYSKCPEPTENIELRDFSLKHWGNPMLQVKRQGWAAWVDEPIVKMVQTWLKLRSIEDFFALLAQDGQARKDRLKFWLRYVDAIDDLYFALGSRARTNPKPDYVRIREHMRGHWMSMGGAADNNAFLMRIGNSLFVEFGQQGNASHVFRFDKLPFKLGSGWVEGTGAGLKNTSHEGHQAKMSHYDGWESEFEATIKRLTGVQPTAASGRQSNRRTPGPDSSAKPSQNTFFDEVRKFAKANGWPVTDNTGRGGNFWVEAPYSGGHALRGQLEKWGFKFKAGRGWWKEGG